MTQEQTDIPNEISAQSINTIVNDFGLEENKFLEHSDLNDLRNALTSKIADLLNNNIEKLMSILYRIDVRQQSVDMIFEAQLKEDIPEKLSDAIINRQLEKARTRHYYKNSKGEQH